MKSALLPTATVPTSVNCISSAELRVAATMTAAGAFRGEVLAAVQQGRLHELVPVAGQSAGLIRDILPAGEIVRRMVAEAQQAPYALGALASSLAIRGNVAEAVSLAEEAVTKWGKPKRVRVEPDP